MIYKNFTAPRLERSSFCVAKRRKKAGVEDGNWRPKKQLNFNGLVLKQTFKQKKLA